MLWIPFDSFVSIQNKTNPQKPKRPIPLDLCFTELIGHFLNSLKALFPIIAAQ